jgi:NADH-quinone oxidoreductase subunit N
MYPIIALSLTGLITLFLGFLPSKNVLLPATLFFITLALVVNFIDWNSPGLYFNEMLEVNNMSLIFIAILLVSALLVMALSGGFLDDPFAQPAEYYALIQFSLVGTIMMVTYNNLIMLFIGIEILSVAMYVLTGSDKRNIRGNEATIKYFLMGAFATGILLFGMAMYYGATLSFDINVVDSLLNSSPERPVYLWIGITFMLIGMLFKVSAAPFHFWTPDVYEGAPTIFTTYMSTIVKTAGFAAIYKIVSVSFGEVYHFWWVMIAVVAVLSLVISNITAVYQQNFKRMLAYSSISHAGYLLLAVVGMSSQSDASIAFYSLAYTLATISAFGVLMAVSKDRLVNGRPDERISVLNGLAKKDGFLAFVLTVSMLSLSGIPLTAGFWGKFFVFSDVASRGYVWLMIIAILMSAVGIYYYFKPIRAAYMKPSEDFIITVRPIYKIVLGLTTFASILLGILPSLIRGFM